MTLRLSSSEPFAQGGNRLCFVHPEDPSRCIKVRRPDFTLEDLRRKKGFPKNLRPLSSFDDNLEEFRVIENLYRTRGEEIHAHVYRSYGFVDTDLGSGLMTELVRDADGRISVSLKQYIWEHGYPAMAREAVASLAAFWLAYLIPSRELLTHNIVVQQDRDALITRLVVIDGLGSPYIVPFGWFPKKIREKKVQERIRRLDMRIDEFVANCASGKTPSMVGMLLHRGSPAGDVPGTGSDEADILYEKA